jgi:hypothetical protein
VNLRNIQNTERLQDGQLYQPQQNHVHHSGALNPKPFPWTFSAKDSSSS